MDFSSNVLVSVDSGGVEVICENTTSGCASLGSDYVCLVTMNKTNNCHVGDCNAENDIEICCKAEGDFTAPTFSLDEPSYE